MRTAIFHIAAAALRTSLTDQSMGGNELFSFAKAHAIDRQLINEALVLQLNYFTALPENRGELAGSIEQLIEKIGQEQEAADFAENRAALEQQHALALENFEALRPAPEVVVELKGIEKRFPGKNGFHLHALSHEFRLGEITGIVGANANGKSTLLRMVVGELLKTRGEIRFPYFQKQKGRRPIPWAEAKHRLSYIPQELPEWNAGLRATLQYEAAIHGIKGKQCDREVDFILERLGLTLDADGKSWRELSGGYKLRFALAKALVWQPSLLVLDEPLANLDVASQTVILNDLRNIAHSFRHPICVLITSQHIHEIENVADRLILLDNGRLRYEGVPGRFGMENDYNLFEFSCPVSADFLSAHLRPGTILRLDDTGFQFLLRTPKSVDSSSLLRELTDAEVPVSYFRDISHSVKQVFYENPSRA